MCGLLISFTGQDQMKIRTLAIYLILFLSFQISLSAYAADATHNGIPFAAARSFFEELNARNYTAVWADLTEKSQKAIIGDVMKEIGKSHSGYSREQIRSDFRTSGPVAVAYWKAFLDNFDPEKALKKSTWKMGEVGKNEAEVIIKYRRAEDSAKLKMFREDGRWKVGLTETFWTRKLF